jgi:ribosomal protein S18 acetylase RimI-like enzyme
LDSLIIRTLSEKDLPALEWEGEFRHFRLLYRQVYENSLQGKAVMWGAELGAVGIIGQLFVQLSSGKIELANGKTRAYVYGFRVRPQYRGQGVGTSLLSTVEADLKKRQYQHICLNVARENLAAQKLYANLGYHIVGAEPGRWSYKDEYGNEHEVNEPAWRMEKRLVGSR